MPRRTPAEQAAYSNGIVQQAVMVSTKPDWTHRQWRDTAAVLEEMLAEAQARVAYLEGRIDVVDTHILHGAMTEG